MVQHYGDTDTVTTDATQRYEEARAAARQAMTRARVDAPPQLFFEDAQVDDPAYRGFKFGAAFFGLLVAISITVLLAGVVGAVAIGVESVVNFTRAEAEQQAGTLGIAAAVIVVLTGSFAFYTGGYVAGRLARFDGARQGFGVWMITLLLLAVAAGGGAFLNSQYDLVGRLDRPDVPLSNDVLLTGGLFTAAALVFLPLLAALLGGKQGQRYHDKIDDMLD